jgi:hypothetical protein
LQNSCAPENRPFGANSRRFSLACPFGHGLVWAARASLLALRTGVKIIDFLGRSSFATASLNFLLPGENISILRKADISNLR